VENAVLDRFIRMYVNEDTLNLGPQGKAALEALFKKAQETGLLPSVPCVDIAED
jgi:predicted solute-binding protein